MNVAKKLETSWSQPAGMLYKQEKLWASRWEELFPARRQLCLRGFPLSPAPPLRVSLSRQTGSPERGIGGLHCCLRFQCPLCVCCCQTSHWPRCTAGGRRIGLWTQTLEPCLSDCHRMLEMKSQLSQGRRSRLGWDWLLLFHSEPD